ncbi:MULTISPECIES: DUF2019 domain-containing protein [Rhodopseudomonas]|uniref:DUF2019 domain-containing protein n=1 Tax=Rhodopseudomonas palustris TaxID=1076 RepID=A0A0D7EJQ8_RHOPL|nr:MULTISPECIES: DUF2019 domain-containing protein [Rhodopseudomonas]KIZ39692.1 hypothetical protein OO17_19660 [Rhodopseudomonas palustris]MDF3811093.1 DUF2019 domain-containing protein [Rhodopseudomonas sp. BAL398]WOK19973.1 DUF2019 domain-containing protein [Rhodopseudomonas sp. BAL398]
MRRRGLEDMTVADLVARFAEICLAQDDALLGGEIAKFNRLFGEMGGVATELKRRDGDQRRALMALYDHPNMQVRLKAAKHTLAVAPVEARQQLEAIASSRWYPQAGEAGMCLWNLDRGVFKPN